MPVPTDIVEVLAAGVDAMSIATGYNFDYGPVDVVKPADRVYPQDFLEFTDEAPAGVQVAGKLTQDITLTFRTIVPRGAGTVDAECAKVLEDHKRLMEALEPSLQVAGMLLAEPVSASWVPRLVRAYPAELRTVYRLRYRQSRANPASP